MTSLRDAELGHLFRRAGFGASDADLAQFSRLGLLSFNAAAAFLIDYQAQPDDVDTHIGKVGYVGITSQGTFDPTHQIDDARQRMLFRFVHSRRPLQEKMTLFWHNHFATAQSKIAGLVTAPEATRMMAAKPSEDPGGVTGQIEMIRENALGNFRDLLIAIAQDPAMLYWLDGRTNVRAHPQENFARELMELFTMGVDTFAEADVYAGARVFSGWNLTTAGTGSGSHNAFSFIAANHDADAKKFTFPIYANGSTTIPARSPSAGMQDGIDLLNAVASHPATGPRLAKKLYAFFVNEVDPPDASLVDEIAGVYYSSNFEIAPMVERILLSTQFRDPSNYFKRYSWPVEFVARALKEAGYVGFSLSDALTPLANMGQQLFEPPDVSGWRIGQSWFSTGSMLARMNFAAQLATNQKFNIRDAYHGLGPTPSALVSEALDRLAPADFDADSQQALVDYLNAGGQWTGADAQLVTKAAGLIHLILGSGEYQLV